MNDLLYFIAVILVILWAIGFLAYSFGALIHILLVLAIIAVLLRLIGGVKEIKSMRVFILFVALSSIFTTLSSAQKDTSSHPTRFDKYYIYSGILDTRDEVVAPIHWKGTQWLTFGVLTGAECGLIFAGGDRSIQSIAQRNRNNTTDFIEKYIGDPFGSGLYPVIFTGTFYLAGCLTHQNHAKHFAMLTAKAVAISGTTAFLIKSVAGRYRPDQEATPGHWIGPKGIFSYDSYPSGHATVAFALSSMVAMEYPRPIIVPVLAYSFAAVTAYGRINGNYHWASDVLLGSAIGYFTSRLVFRHDNWSKCRKHSS